MRSATPQPGSAGDAAPASRRRRAGRDGRRADAAAPGRSSGTGARVPHLERPLCEPVELRPGARVRVERVRQGPEAGASAPFPHFHDVHELVLFGRVRGTFVAGGRRWTLAPYSIAFVPSTLQHDFALAPGPRDWVLVQIGAGAGDALSRRPGLDALGGAFCARPDAAARERIGLLADWLLALPADDPQVPALVELLLHAAARAPKSAGELLPAHNGELERLRPAIERLRRDPAHAPGAAEAAALCALSPAYFSRRFKRQIGMSWSDYVRTHRLHLASQRLLDDRQSVAAIAESLGFSTPSHFGEVFLRRFGITPNAYRRRARG